jgi:ADP-ribosylglycohydrolase
MLGAIAGDIIGSPYEADAIKHKAFPLFSERSRFTDDTVLTLAVAQHFIRGTDYVSVFHEYASVYPYAGYGGSFRQWAQSGATEPYGSWGNGSAMRVSPVGWACKGEAEVLDEAHRSAAVTHDHPDGIHGAQAVALAVYLARTGRSRQTIRDEICARFGYDLSRTVEEIRPTYEFDVSCQGSVPESLICFLDSEDFEDAIRNAVSLGGDADTMACIAGAIAEAFYGGVPSFIETRVYQLLPRQLGVVVRDFRERYCQ